MSAGTHESGIRKLYLPALLTDDMEASRASVRLKAATHVAFVSLNVVKQDDFTAGATLLLLLNSISWIGGVLLSHGANFREVRGDSFFQG